MTDERHRTPDPDATRDLGAAAPVTGSGPFVPGAVFAERYEIEAVIGSGGTGQVFRALDRITGTRVALKILHGAGPRAGERLRRELRAVRALRHPGIVRVFDLGLEGERLYTVAELLEGENLSEYLTRSGPLPEQEVLRILRGILGALAAAHEAGVVHRDIKPANIFLARKAGGERQVILLDFGLARQATDPGLTETGQFVGTPAYTAPEQILGRDDAGPRADLYSVGITAWEMLTGRPPFEGGSQVEVLREHLETPPPLPALRSAGAGRRLRELILDLLEKEPQHRPRDARAALELLTAARTRLRLRHVTRRLRRVVTRRSRTILLAGGVLAAVWGAGWLLTPVSLRFTDRTLTWELRAGFVVPHPPFDRPITAAALDPHRGLGPVRRALVALEAPGGGRVPYVPPDEDVPAVVEIGFPPIERTPRVRVGSGVYKAPDHFGALVPRTVHGVFPLEERGDGSMSLALYLETGPHWQSTFAFDGYRRPATAPAEFSLGGQKGGFLHVPAEESGADVDQFVLVGPSNWAGPRLAVVSVPLSPVGEGQPPPYVFPLSRAARSRGWTYFFPAIARLRDEYADRDGDVITVYTRRDTVRLSAATGIPLDAEHRHGLDEAAWAAYRNAMEDALESAAWDRSRELYAKGAETLENFAAAPGLPPEMASLALYRAALLHMDRAADATDDAHGRALEVIERALALEPQAARYKLLKGELLARRGESEAFAELLHGEYAIGFTTQYLYEWMLANEIAGRPIDPVWLDETWHAFRAYVWGTLCSAHVGYVTGQPHDALSALPLDSPPEQTWDLHMYWGARAALALSPPDPELALAYLDRMPAYGTGGWMLPSTVLRARAETLTGVKPGDETRAAVQAELEELRRRSASSLHALAMLRYAEDDARSLQH